MCTNVLSNCVKKNGHNWYGNLPKLKLVYISNNSRLVKDNVIKDFLGLSSRIAFLQ